jgi:hypothetical protein
VYIHRLPDASTAGFPFGGNTNSMRVSCFSQYPKGAIIKYIKTEIMASKTENKSDNIK